MKLHDYKVEVFAKYDIELMRKSPKKLVCVPSIRVKLKTFPLNKLGFGLFITASISYCAKKWFKNAHSYLY